MKWIYWLMAAGTLYIAYQTLEFNPFATILLAFASIAWSIAAFLEDS
jgi:hypothetical protein